jgi:mannosyl-oligosaccharide alpha-1,2-mannosidase
LCSNASAEYLIKQYLQTSKEEPLYLELWNEALAGIRKHLVTYTKRSHLTVVGERPDGLGNPLLPKMDHLVCFLPGTIALAATDGQTLTAARKTQGWSQKQEEEMDLAKELIKTCWGMYKATRTGLAPEITYFEVDDPPLSEADGKLSSASIDFAEVPSFGDAPWKSDYIIKNQDSHNLQRPETAESLFYMWRITGDVTYREWGWEMFKSFLNYTSVEGGGYTSLSNANVIPPLKKDNMESFWLAETLKYLYLLFSPNTLLPLDNVVINTEAHVFPRFKLTKGFKTGWNRKPRDSAGRIIQAEMHEENREAPALPRIPLRHQNPNPYMGRPQMGPKVVKVVDAKAESDAMEKVEVEARKLSTQDDSEA